MKKAFKLIMIGLVAALAVILLVLPLAVPPAVEYIVMSKLSEFGLMSKVDMSFGYCWRNGPGISGACRVSVLDSPWNVAADFGASCCEWAAHVSVPKTAFSTDDPLIRTLRQRFPSPVTSNLTLTGVRSLEAKAERTFRKPVPVWSVKVPIRDVNAQLDLQGKTYSLADFSITPGISGIADHRDILPMFPRAREICLNGFAMTNFYATIRATEQSLMMNEAGAGFCGGKVNVYSLFLNPKMLDAGFTMFVDDIDAGQALEHFKGFRGKASGRLHGKVGLFIRRGGSVIRMNDAFLYSTPGETGKLQLEEPKPITDNLALAGIDEKARDNVANALTDLDYSVLKLTLRRIEGNMARLSVQIDGTATRGELTVPVNLKLNINGEIEQLINTGLSYSAKLKGKKK